MMLIIVNHPYLFNFFQRNLTEQQRESLSKDFMNLNLSKYIGEAVSIFMYPYHIKSKNHEMNLISRNLDPYAGGG